MDYATLNNGVKIPQLGLGTYLLEPDDAQSSVAFALNAGYELIDTANAYVNERAVDRSMRAPNLPRENVFLEEPYRPHELVGPKARPGEKPLAGTTKVKLSR